MTVTPEGTLLVVDKLANRIRELRFKNSSRCANVTTFAGDGTFGWTDGPLDFANFYQPSNIVAAPDGSVFVCDAGNHRIRRIKPNGNVYHYAGIIRCNEIVTNDPVKDILKDKRIRWEFFTEGVEDGQATDTAQFHNPEGIGLGPDGSVYVADSNNDRIRRISPDGFKVSTYVGKKGFGRGVEDGPLYKARFFNPYGLTVSPNGNVYISEWCTQRIRLITPNRVVTTIAGDGTEGYQDGTGTNSKFSYPLGLASDKEGNVYVADKHNNAIRMISPELQVTTIVGGNGWGQRDGLVEYAQLNAPRSITISPDGSIYISDLYNMLVRKVIYTNSPQLEESKEEDLPKAPKTSQILSMYSMLKQARNMSALIDPKEAEWSPDRGFYTSEQHVTGPLSKRGNEGLPGDTW
uniref:SMP-30/Gluconolactonase/LRE-like region domain-containing protein n=1 Tax=Amorphochlora amoebiformis TaxID=1561963 RepID=A0A7S0CRC9_9EUKA